MLSRISFIRVLIRNIAFICKNVACFPEGQTRGRAPFQVASGIISLLTLGICCLTFNPTAQAANRWEAAISKFEQLDRENPPAKGGILFVGSSSIVLWDLDKSFPKLPTINRGFGGSQIADSIHFADRIVLPYRPKTIVFYAGDNDLAAGKSAQTVADDYRRFVKIVHAELPQTQILYVAIKPCIARWKLIDKVRKANDLIRAQTEKDERLIFVDIATPMLGPDGKPRAELFKKDRLHLNEKGYRLWNGIVGPLLVDKS